MILFLRWIGLVLLARASPTCCLMGPRFVSDWYWMDVNNRTSTHVTIEHNFGVYPSKAEVQVLSSSGIIYPGIPNNNNDNDYLQFGRGGVMYRYNTDLVELIGATNDDDCAGTNFCVSLSSNAYIVFTGRTGWISQNQEVETAAHVRIRLWHPDDLPAPSFQLDNLFMDMDADSFQSREHNLGQIPELASVQFKLSDDWMGEAHGSDSHPGKSYLSWGGVMFAVDGSHIRLWVPTLTGTSRKDNYIGIMSFCDGWGNFDIEDCRYTAAHMRIQLWRDVNAEMIYSNNNSYTIGPIMTGSPHELTFNDTIDPVTDMILVTVEAVDGNNAGFYFHGAGAAMLDGPIDGVSGVVYGYTINSVRLWHPVFDSSYDRCIVRISSAVGDGQLSQCSLDANIHVTIWKASPLCNAHVVLPIHTIVVSNHTFNLTFECVEFSFFVGGDLFIKCIDGAWNGTLPTCVSQPCRKIPDLLVSNNTLNMTFECTKLSVLTDGDLFLECIDGVWNGTLPTCVACSPFPTLPENTRIVSNNTLNMTLECTELSFLIDGDLFLECIDGVWNGTLPTCVTCSPFPTLPENTRIVSNNTLNMTLECTEVSVLVDGDLFLECIDGIWNGTLPTCVTCSPFPTLPENTRIVSNNTLNMTFECTGSSFLIDGDLFLECIDGVWNGTLPTCVTCSPFPTLPENTRIVTNKTLNMTLECAELSVLVDGDLFLECIDGIWNSTLPTCRTCSTFSTLPENTRLVSNNTLNMTFECTELSVLIDGDLFLECIDGVWNGTLPSCVTCSPFPSLPENTRIVSNYTLNLTLECTELSFLVDGGLFIECIDGVWNGTIPTCEYCPPLESGTNVLLSLTVLVEKNSANYSCLPFHHFTSGDLQRTCLHNGTHVHWTGSPPVCRPLNVSQLFDNNSTQVCMGQNNSTDAEILQATIDAAEISKNLTVDHRKTSNYLRTLTSADDDRSSSFFIAVLGIVFISTVLVMVVAADALNICQTYCQHKVVDIPKVKANPNA